MSLRYFFVIGTSILQFLGSAQNSTTSSKEDLYGIKSTWKKKKDTSIYYISISQVDTIQFGSNKNIVLGKQTDSLYCFLRQTANSLYLTFKKRQRDILDITLSISKSKTDTSKEYSWEDLIKPTNLIFYKYFDCTPQSLFIRDYNLVFHDPYLNRLLKDLLNKKQ